MGSNQISGEKDKDELRRIVGRIRKILNENNGNIVHDVRVKEGAVATFQLTFVSQNQTSSDGSSGPDSSANQRGRSGSARKKAAKKK